MCMRYPLRTDAPRQDVMGTKVAVDPCSTQPGAAATDGDGTSATLTEGEADPEFFEPEGEAEASPRLLQPNTHAAR